jgi:hypothetical protein
LFKRGKYQKGTAEVTGENTRDTITLQPELNINNLSNDIGIGIGLRKKGKLNQT